MGTTVIKKPKLVVAYITGPASPIFNWENSKLTHDLRFDYVFCCKKAKTCGTGHVYKISEKVMKDPTWNNFKTKTKIFDKQDKPQKSKGIQKAKYPYCS